MIQVTMLYTKLIGFLMGFALVSSQDLCRKVTFDDCHNEPPLMTYQDINVAECQEKQCNQLHNGECKFFLYDRKHKLCELFNFDYVEYIETCTIIGGPKNVETETCGMSSDACNVCIFILLF